MTLTERKPLTFAELAQRGYAAAQFYEKNPGLAAAGAIVDLYRVIAWLCEELERRDGREAQP